MGNRIAESPPVGAHPKQIEFIESPKRWCGYIGGRGSGKSYASILKALREAGGPNAPCTGALVAPTYTMLQDGLLKLFWKIVPDGMVKEFSKGRMVATLGNGSEIFFRSGDDPDRMRGLNLSWFGLDEACYMDGAIWPISTATLREGGRAGKAWVTTTPKGYDWVYKVFVSNATDDHLMVQSHTNDNIFLAKEFRQDVIREHGAGWFAQQEISGAFVEAGGGINVSNVEVLDSRPIIREWVRYWDTAATRRDGDYTVGLLMGKLRDGSFVIADVIRGQWSTSEVEALLLATAEQDGQTVRIRIEQEPGASGKQIIDVFKNLLYRFDVDGNRVSGAKAQRIAPFAAQVEAGNVAIVRGGWNEAFLEECQTYAPGERSSRKRKDDQLDAASGAFMELGLSNWTAKGYRGIESRRWNRRATKIGRTKFGSGLRLVG